MDRGGIWPTTLYRKAQNKQHLEAESPRSSPESPHSSGRRLGSAALLSERRLPPQPAKPGPMAFAARRSLASRFSHHLTRRLHPSVPHLLSRSNDDEPPSQPQPHPLPSLRSPLPPASGAAQTLHHPFPFSLHHSGLPRRSFSSSAPAPAPDPPGEVDAAASVLVDAVASSVPAPFPGEVAAAAADSFFPFAALQHLIDTIHTFTGLNWWASIALTAVLIRTAVIPFTVSHQKSGEKIHAMKPEVDAIKHAVDINNMVEKVPSLKGGGIFWFTDLTTPDPLYILPVLTSLTFLATVELGNPYIASKMKMLHRGMGVMIVPFTMNFAKGFFFYWITANLFTLVYVIVMRRPTVRKLFNFPALEAQSAPALNSALDMFGGSKAVPSAKPPLALTELEEVRSEIEYMAAQPRGSPEWRKLMALYKHCSSDFGDAAALGYRPKKIEKKGKSIGKSRKGR
ncbi:mitochondrial inner membrane protein OXA1 isoform X2 [Aegilops tauschii subsp. strangulata]|uniref:mitochondrial inner membrane protein OXA1 isoform X2 n=1 Tax=Aegilops tauschii subsp. strangulata TaxID=200361 RepID=UPI001ABD1E70|nr:mitochondrial inner membrane protein OXA1 isoform X3 [Aegilops tauschii subsp. strangulata]